MRISLIIPAIVATAMTLSACTTPASEAGLPSAQTATATASAGDGPSTSVTPPTEPSQGNPVTLPPDFDAYQNACIPLKDLREDAWLLVAPMVRSSPTDASRQAALVPTLIDYARSARIDEYGDPRVTDAKARVAGYVNVLKELRRAASSFAANPNETTYATWEEVWAVVDGSAALLTYQCR